MLTNHEALHISELEKANERLTAEMKNLQQIIYLKNHDTKQLKKKIAKLELECKNIQQAFDSYANEKESDEAMNQRQTKLLKEQMYTRRESQQAS